MSESLYEKYRQKLLGILKPPFGLKVSQSYIITSELISRLRDLEKRAYNSTNGQSYMMMQHCRTPEDFASFCGAPLESIHVYGNGSYYFIYSKKDDEAEIIDFASVKPSAGMISDVTRIVGEIDVPITCNARSSTSYPLIKFFESKGVVQIIEDDENTWGGEVFHRIKMATEKSLQKEDLEVSRD